MISVAEVSAWIDCACQAPDLTPQQRAGVLREVGRYLRPSLRPALGISRLLARPLAEGELGLLDLPGLQRLRRVPAGRRRQLRARWRAGVAALPPARGGSGEDVHLAARLLARARRELGADS